jgi:hypothetical protein
MKEPLEAIEQRYSRLSDEELLLIVHDPTRGYRPEAVELAHEELSRRGNPQGRTEALAAAVSAMEKEQEPLPDLLKIVCVALPGLPGLIVWASMASQGRRRAASDALRWLGVGIGVATLLVILSLLGVR